MKLSLVLLQLVLVAVALGKRKNLKCSQPTPAQNCDAAAVCPRRCPKGELCCDNGCGGKECRDGIPKGCPPPANIICIVRNDQCGVNDLKCEKGYICCPHPSCGNECVLKRRCPKPKGAGTCVEACSDANPCPADQLCCSNGCGHSCMDPKVGGGKGKGKGKGKGGGGKGKGKGKGKGNGEGEEDDGN